MKIPADSALPIPPPVLRRLGVCGYEPTWAAMRDFTEHRRNRDLPDEFWVLQHPPVFTQGSNGQAEHVLLPGDIPVVQSDRGGQVTYHGPGQIMLYVMVDINRLGIGVRTLVGGLEQAMVKTLAEYGIRAQARPDAPGVYVGDAKIGSIGLRIRHGYSYHGLALNVDMDLEPFERINPCGYQGLTMTQLRTLAGPQNLDQVAGRLIENLTNTLHLPDAETESADSPTYENAAKLP